VTGGSRGIGEAIVESFVREGARVAFTYRGNEARAHNLAQRLISAGAEVLAIQADAADEEACQHLVVTTVDAFGSLNIVVNNAGIAGMEKRTEDLSLDEWNRVMATDLTGAFLTTKHALPHITASPKGKIINVASELAFKGRAGFSHYCAAKAGVIGYTYALALELAPTICVNAIAPGPIDTEMITKDLGAEWAEIEKDIPAGRLGKPSEVAETAVLLASDAGDFYIGQVLSPNGGAVLR
jgi:3-oxoacyl-[acyl-carrier protein] reductase